MWREYVETNIDTTSDEFHKMTSASLKLLTIRDRKGPSLSPRSNTPCQARFILGALAFLVEHGVPMAHPRYLPLAERLASLRDETTLTYMISEGCDWVPKEIAVTINSIDVFEVTVLVDKEGSEPPDEHWQVPRYLRSSSCKRFFEQSPTWMVADAITAGLHIRRLKQLGDDDIQEIFHDYYGPLDRNNSVAQIIISYF